MKFKIVYILSKMLVCGKPWPCDDFVKVWGYDYLTNRCIFFYYGGCGGNPNRFYTKEECLKTCRVYRPANRKKREENLDEEEEEEFEEDIDNWDKWDSEWDRMDLWPYQYLGYSRPDMPNRHWLQVNFWFVVERKNFPSSWL